MSTPFRNESVEERCRLARISIRRHVIRPKRINRDQHNVFSHWCERWDITCACGIVKLLELLDTQFAGQRSLRRTPRTAIDRHPKRFCK